jgi:hypothetical protein
MCGCQSAALEDVCVKAFAIMHSSLPIASAAQLPLRLLFFYLIKRTKNQADGKAFLPHEAFALQKLAPQSVSHSPSATFQPKAFPSAGLCALFMPLLIEEFLSLEIFRFSSDRQLRQKIR